MNSNRGASHGRALIPHLEIEDIEELQDHEENADVSPPEVAPTSGGTKEDSQLSYVVCTTQHGRDGNTLGNVHTISLFWRTKTLCGWRFTNTVDHIVTDCPFPSQGGLVPLGAPRCSTCVKREEQNSL